MTLDPETCWRAMSSRDRRFEGRFVTGVLTTRIYCRPGCPARLPRRENVRFFACAAAAEERGLRPCLRCRPDSSPATPAAIGAPTTVSRALRLIGEGHVDDLEELAERLGVGARHLRRLFAEHLGASPIAVARTQKLHFARKLLEETALPVTDVAFASGFRSVRRFNDAFRHTFRATPSDLRRARGDHGARDVVRLRLPLRPPIAWSELLAFLAARATPGVEEVELAAGAYRRTFDEGGARGVLEARLAEGGAAIALEVRASSPRVSAEVEGRLRRGAARGPLAPAAPLFTLVQRARALFDLDADPVEIAGALGRRRELARHVRARPGLRVPGAFDGFEVAVRAILGQQVTVRGATSLAGRLADAFGAPFAAPAGALTRVFPTPAALADADVARIGLPRARADAIRELARRVARGELALHRGAGEDAERALCDVRGIGPWTAAYVAMRAMGSPDALPAGDLALRRALGVDTAREVEARADAWRPWRAYAAMHVWTAMNDEKETR